MRYFIEGILSFVKGCEQYVFGARSETRFQLLQNSENPAAYAKLSCHLPWIAEQYGMDFTEDVEDYRKECSKGTGDVTDFNEEQCRSNSDQESACIFPFYWNGRFHDECVFLEEQEFLFPVFRCPIRNITRKIDGVNSFIYSDLNTQVNIERKCNFFLLEFWL